MSNTIGILTSGGDAPGMNAAIRAVTRSALRKGFTVLGIERGYNGLINAHWHELKRNDVSDIIHRGGTILYTARCLEFKEDAGIDMAKKICDEAGISGLVVIGGDGSFRGAADLAKRGIPCVGLPGTIDNDISCTEYTIGYDTAMNTAMEMVDKIRDTAQSHDRCSVVEVMGRNAGWIALNTGIACGATAVITKEVPYDIDAITQKMKTSHKLGKQHFIIMVSEGIGNSVEIAKEIEEKTGIESRATILGHVQRGGNPTLRDRVVATKMGSYAVDLLSEILASGETNRSRVVGMQKGQIVDFDIQEALKMKKPFDMDAYDMLRNISI